MALSLETERVIVGAGRRIGELEMTLEKIRAQLVTFVSHRLVPGDWRKAEIMDAIGCIDGAINLPAADVDGETK